MKSTVVPYETRVQCGRVVCRSGLTVRIAAYPFDLKMSNGNVYQAGSGFEYSALVAETSFAASVVDLEGFVGYAGITRDMLQSGVFDGAEAFYFYADFLSPVEDAQPHMKAVFGKTEISDDRYRIEQMQTIDLLSQPVAVSVSPMCRNTFGGQEYGGCGVGLGAITVTGTLTSVTSSLVIADTARAEAADYFGAGVIRFTSGPNAGLADIRVESFASGVITLANAPYYPLATGVTYEMEPGCRKHLAGCQGHNNEGRMKAYLHVPPKSVYTSVGGTE